MALTATQRKHLRRLAHHIDPVVIVGKQGVTESLIDSVNAGLDAHELIKVRFNDFKDEKKTLAPMIAERTQCEMAGLIGHVAILYRAHRDPEKRRIELPA